MEIIILFCAAAVCIIAEMLRELRTFKVTTYRIRSPKLDAVQEEKKIIFLSDLHNQTYGADNQKLLHAVRKERPDIILVGGDMVVSKNGCDYTPALRFVKRLADICPVYYANGNHEQRMKERPWKYEQSIASYKAELEHAGVRFLENASARLELGQTPVCIYGLEIPQRCYTHFGKEEMRAKELEQKIGHSDQSAFNILMAHNPGYVKEYKEWGADLILSGHLHGGSIRIPGLGGLIAPNLELFPRYSGDLYEEGDTSIVVSKGLGTHTIRIRLFNPAEVVVLKLG